MDSQKRDELRERRREEALARRMGEALDRFSPREAGDCPEADIIAAYHERALELEEAAQWESHFAGCARCRKVLAVLAASLDAPLAENEVARLGELVASAVRTPGGAPSQKLTPIRPSRWDWRTRWLAPALGVAAVLTIWFAMRPPWRANAPESSRTLIAQGAKNESPQETDSRNLEQLSKKAPGRNEEAGTTPPKDQRAPKTLSVNPEPNPSAANRMADSSADAEIAPTARVAGGIARDKTKEQGESNTAAAVAPAPAPAPQPQLQTSLGGPDATETPRSTSQSVTVTGAAPMVSTTEAAPSGKVTAQSRANLPLNGRNFQEFSKLGAAPRAPVQLQAPSGTILWRAGISGSIQHSSDAGAAWVVEKSPSREDWLAGSAVSDTACWLVGRNGAIARTTDGQHWKKIAPPPTSANASGKFPDWIGVAAPDAQFATITANDGRRFATSDGGKTWQPQS